MKNIILLQNNSDYLSIFHRKLKYTFIIPSLFKEYFDLTIVYVYQNLLLSMILKNIDSPFHYSIFSLPLCKADIIFMIFFLINIQIKIL